MNKVGYVKRLCFGVVIVLCIISSGDVGSQEAREMESIAREVLEMISAFDGLGRISEPDLERLQRHANPKNATAAIEIIPNLLHAEIGFDIHRLNAYAGFLRSHTKIFGYATPRMYLDAIRKVEEVEDMRWHYLCYNLVLYSIRIAAEEEKEPLLFDIMELFPFSDGNVNTLVLSAIAHEYSRAQAIDFIDQLIVKHSDKASFVNLVKESRERYWKRMMGIVDDEIPGEIYY